jgi:hypothetical protein
MTPFVIPPHPSRVELFWVDTRTFDVLAQVRTSKTSLTKRLLHPADGQR